MAKNLQPVSLAGIEFDALIDEQKDMNATIPTYVVDKGFPVSDTIILDPLTVKMTLYISNTPVTWLSRHGSSTNRVNEIVEKLENLWLSKKLVKVVTTDTIYKNMGIVSMSIKKSYEIGYAREVSLQLQKVVETKSNTVKIPKKILKSGKTKANAGKASTSNSSSKSSSSKSSSNKNSSNSGSSSNSSSKSSSSSSSSSSNSTSKKNQSILYGAASGLGFI